MADSSIEVIDHFPQIIEALEEAAKVAIRQVARDLTHEANDAAPYATGALAASGYYVASDISTYGQAVAAAEGANAEARMLPEVDHPDGETEAIIAYAASHAAYVHDGTRHMGARPWLAQTAAGAQDRVMGAVAKVISDALTGAGISD